MKAAVPLAGLAGMSAVFLGVIRNKKSVVIDLKHADGQAALLQLNMWKALSPVGR